MDRADKIRIQHMIDAADEALKFAENKTVDNDIPQLLAQLKEILIN